jgi:hypothetical protein
MGDTVCGRATGHPHHSDDMFLATAPHLPSGSRIRPHPYPPPATSLRVAGGPRAESRARGIGRSQRISPASCAI